ncbi:MAG: hypothetical protein M5U18_19620 [Dehalococcoidia bacterium]|nr:hypothetical protein [Dehalococcoidia bacterium]
MRIQGALGDEATSRRPPGRTAVDGHAHGDGVHAECDQLAAARIDDFGSLVAGLADHLGAPASVAEDAVGLVDDGLAFEVGEDAAIISGALADEREVERLGEEVENLLGQAAVGCVGHAARCAGGAGLRRRQRECSA